MNLLVTLDENYLSPLRVMLHSLFTNNKWAHVHVYLMHSSIGPQKLEELQKFIKSYKSTLTIIRVGEELFEDAPQRLHITKETYYRLLVMDYLNENIKRILYLDPDIIVNHSIKNFYQCDMKDFLFAGAADSSMNQMYNPHKQSLGIPSSATYINAGVLLMNLENLRKSTTTKQIIEEIYQNYDRLKVQDQDFINMQYHGKIRVVTNKYNRDANYLNIKDRWEYPLIRIKQFLKKQNVVIHYLGPKKPWKENYGGKYLAEYWKYARVVTDKETRKVMKKNLRNWMYYWLKETD